MWNIYIYIYIYIYTHTQDQKTGVFEKKKTLFQKARFLLVIKKNATALILATRWQTCSEKRSHPWIPFRPYSVIFWQPADF